MKFYKNIFLLSLHFLLQSSLIATLNTVEVEVTTLAIMKSTNDIATPLTVNEEDITLTITNSTKEICMKYILYC